jgi:hypothetical protein
MLNLRRRQKRAMAGVQTRRNGTARESQGGSDGGTTGNDGKLQRLPASNERKDLGRMDVGSLATGQEQRLGRRRREGSGGRKKIN